MSEEFQIAIVAITVLVFALVGFLIILFTSFYRRKSGLILEKKEQEVAFKSELVNVQDEIREQTLKNVGWELHDNIGQLLSVAKMKTYSLPPEESTHISEVISDAITQVRGLSRSLNNEIVGNKGLHNAIEDEVQRCDKVYKNPITFSLQGEPISLPKEHELILFRLFQESVNNGMKHSEAQNILVSLDYGVEYLVLTIKDDGVGFDVESDKVKNSTSSGLTNLSSRAALIGASVKINSTLNIGTQIQFKYPLHESNRNPS